MSPSSREHLARAHNNKLNKGNQYGCLYFLKQIFFTFGDEQKI